MNGPEVILESLTFTVIGVDDAGFGRPIVARSRTLARLVWATLHRTGSG